MLRLVDASQWPNDPEAKRILVLGLLLLVALWVLWIFAGFVALMRCIIHVLVWRGFFSYDLIDGCVVLFVAGVNMRYQRRFTRQKCAGDFKRFTMPKFTLCPDLHRINIWIVFQVNQEPQLCWYTEVWDSQIAYLYGFKERWDSQSLTFGNLLFQ